ncbi:YhgE/Pip family protein [Cellulomonas sp. URHD0024]|uniref:YhgE/Pip family protein n=1 Tax=Cellulomonas sp. URHD0024 TaxID=1302620 RepID=UPI00040C0FC8|nr:YhgE/Pip domain-containing protein [Cellulomonas sp. URHD0024]
MLSLTSGSELRRFRRGRLPRVAVAVMLLVPLLYGALYLWAFWSPTAHLDRLPVALVNSDTGGTRTDGGRLTAGADLTDQLTGADALDWHLTGASDAASGVRDGTYYFSVTIPDDFSAALLSAGGDAPTSARIDVTYNDANSFIGTTLGRAAMTQVRDAVAATAGQEAVDQVLVGLGSARDGLSEASDAAVSLHDAARTLGDGATRVADAAGQARAGSAQLAAGSVTLRSGAAQVADGSAAVADGAGRLSEGAQAASGSSVALAAGTRQVADGVHEAVGQVDTVSSGLAQVGGYLQGRAAAGDPEAAALLAALGSADLPGMATRLHQLDAGAAQVDSGATALRDGLTTLAGSAQTLSTGATSVADGASRLSDGTADAAVGAATLAAGTAALADGASHVASGTTQVSDGTRQLAEGLDAGTAQIPDDSSAQRTARARTIANPVALESTDLATADSLGEGFAPMFLPMALFVGGIVTWLLMRPLPTRALATPAAGWRVAIAGYLPALAIGTGQVLFLLGVVGLGLGLHVGHPVGTAAFLVLVAATFLAVQQMLIAVLGPAAGKVATIALLMLQITSASGTYPVQTTPAFFQALHPILPMTYAVQGLRDLVTGSPDARLWFAVGYLVAVLLASLAVTSWKAGRMRTWTIARLHPALTL